MDLRIPQTSKQYIYAPVASTTSPTSLPVSIAIVPRDEEPETADFKTADWEPSTTNARILIGPGSTVGELSAGSYRVWVKVDGAVEDPVILVPNYLVIYEVP
jgi:hypothetical protein